MGYIILSTLFYLIFYNLNNLIIIIIIEFIEFD